MKQCQICDHPKLPAIDKAIVLGDVSQAQVARDYGVSKFAVTRHKQNHILESKRRRILAHNKQAVALTEEREVAQTLNDDRADLVSEMRWCVRKIKEAIPRAEASGDNVLQIQGLKAFGGEIERLAKLTGQLSQSLNVVIDLNSSPQWLELREILANTFKRHPDAEATFIELVRHMGVLPRGAKKFDD